MDPIEIKTVHGFTVTINPFLTYDQYIAINSLWTKDMKLDPNKVDKDGKPEKPTMGLISMNLINEANKMATEFLVIKIVNTKGEEVPHAKGELPIPAVDAKPIIDKIQEIQKETSSAFEGEKK